jgi:hypothetical protein
MQTALISSKVEKGGTAGYEEATPSRYTTTLYALLTAIQEVVGPEDDAQVIATVVHLLQSGRLTWLGPPSGPLDPSRRAARGTRQYVCLPVAAERSGLRGQQEECTPQRAPHT